MKTIYLLIVCILLGLPRYYAAELELIKGEPQTLSVILPMCIGKERQELIMKVIEQRLIFITGDNHAKAVNSPAKKDPFWHEIRWQFINHHHVDLELLSRSLLVDFSMAFYRIITDPQGSKEEIKKLRRELYSTKDQVTLVTFKNTPIITEKDLASLAYFEDKNLNKMGVSLKFTPEGLMKINREISKYQDNWLYVFINHNPQGSFLSYVVFTVTEDGISFGNMPKNQLRMLEMQFKYPLPVD